MNQKSIVIRRFLTLKIYCLFYCNVSERKKTSVEIIQIATAEGSIHHTVNEQNKH